MEQMYSLDQAVRMLRVSERQAYLNSLPFLKRCFAHFKGSAVWHAFEDILNMLICAPFWGVVWLVCWFHDLGRTDNKWL